MERINEYVIKKTSDFFNDDYLIVASLYQPIINIKAYQLFLLLSFYQDDKVKEKKISLETLLALLNFSYHDFNQAQADLKTIGLLKITKSSTNKRFFLKPQLPLSAFAFFQNQMLSSHLLNKVGEKNFAILQDQFLIESPEEENEINSVLLVPVDFVSVDNYLISKKANHKLYLPYQKNIQQLVNYYNVKTSDLSKFVYKSIEISDNKRIFNFDAFRTMVIDYYQKTVLKNHLHGEQINFAISKENVVEPLSIKDVKINEMMTIDPINYYTLLTERAPTPDILELIQILIIDYNLTLGVVNCLIEYVWFKNNYRIENKYCQKIAGTFSQLKITSVNDAMEHLKKAYLNSNKKTKLRDSTKKSLKFKPYQQPVTENQSVSLAYDNLSQEEIKKLLEPIDKQKAQEIMEELINL